MGIIVSGFSNIGKSSLKNFRDINYIDLDTCYFNKIDNWIDIYIDCALALREKYDYVLITTYDGVLQELNKKGINYYLVYPKKELKEEYRQRAINKGSDKAFVDSFFSRWDSHINDCIKNKNKNKIILNENEYLSDVILSIKENKIYIDNLIQKFEIATDRLYIRRFILEDTYDFYKMMSSKKVTKYLSDGINSLDKARKFLKKQISGYEIGKKLSFAIILKENNNLIGNLVLKLDDENSSIEIGYVLNDNYWNKGYTTEIVQNIINIIFTKLDFNRIYAGIISDNVSSIRVLEKCKMKYEGKLKQAKYDKKTNKYNDYVYYAILKDEYISKK